MKIFTFLVFLILVPTLSKAQTYTITNVSWTNQVDDDEDGYTQARLMNITVNASANTSAIFETRAWPDGQAEALYGNTTNFAVLAGIYTYTVPIGYGSNIGGELDHGTYDFRVLLRTGINGTILAQRGPSDDTDLNNENFETRVQDEYVTVIYPNGGESFTIGQQIQIQWNISLGVELSFVYISRNGGSSFELIGGNSGTSLNWTVTGPGSNTCKIRVLGRDIAGTFSINDLSDANFSISDNCSLSQTNNIPNPVSAAGGNYNINVNLSGSCTWSITDNASWITCSPISGGNGTTQVGVSISANSGSQRSGTITITSAGATGSPITINVTQSAVPCNLTQTNTIPNPVSATGGNYNISVSLSGSCTWNITDDANWITCSPISGGNGTTQVGVSISANSGGQRTGTLTITSAGATGSPITINVTQSAVPCNLTQTNTIPNPVSATGGNYNISVSLSGSCTWNITDDANWITCSPISGGNGTTQVGVSISANSGSQRSGTITITSAGATGSPITINVTQSAATQSCNLTQTNNIPDPVLSEGGSFSSQVTLSGTTCNDWVANSSVGWITLNPSTGGNGLTNMSINVAQNTGSERTGTITITSAGATGSPISITVNQNSFVCAPGWIPVQNQQYTMNMIAQLNFPEGLSTNINDVVGAFVGSECRGMASPTTDEGRIYLSISSNQASGELVNFKAWRASTCEELPVLETIVFQDNQIIGTYSEPFQFTAGLSTLNLTFNPLYTWFSVNVNPGNMGLSTLFTNPPANTKIIGQTSFAIWTGTAWQGSLTQIDPKKGYVMYVEQPYNVSISGTAIEPVTNPISLGTGWNWIGYLPQLSLPIGIALQNTVPNWVNNEFIKNQTQFAVYSNNNWAGSLTTLYPGSGYKVQVTSPKVLTYPGNSDNFNKPLENSVLNKKMIRLQTGFLFQTCSTV